MAYINGNYEEASSDISEVYACINAVVPTSSAMHVPSESTSAISPFSGYAHIVIDEGTILTSKEGKLTDTITAVMPDIPTSSVVPYTVLAGCDLEPYGATFNHPQFLTFSYNPLDITKGVSESDLLIGTWDNNYTNRTILQGHVDLDAHSITFSIEHLAVYALLAPPPT